MKLGDKVRITRPGSVHWFTGPHMREKPMTIEGRIVEVDFEHIEGFHARPRHVLFEDGRSSWWDDWELEVI